MIFGVLLAANVFADGKNMTKDELDFVSENRDVCIYKNQIFSAGSKISVDGVALTCRMPRDAFDSPVQNKDGKTKFMWIEIKE